MKFVARTSSSFFWFYNDDELVCEEYIGELFKGEVNFADGNSELAGVSS